jgi:hypothetical protein
VGRAHIGQSSGHSRYVLHLEMLTLHFNSSSAIQAEYRHIVSYLSFSLLFYYLILETTSRVLQSGMRTSTSTNVVELISTFASSPGYRAQTSLPPSRNITPASMLLSINQPFPGTLRPRLHRSVSYTWALGWTRCPSAGLGSLRGSPEC